LPLNEDAIKSVGFFHNFDRRFVQINSYYTDPKHPKFRKAETFRVTPQQMIAGPELMRDMNQARNGLRDALPGIILHESRCLQWRGRPTTDQRRLELRGWDDSVLERCWDALRQVAEDYGAKTMLFGRLSQAIYKIKDLYKMITGKQMDVLTARAAMLDLSRSRARAILLDQDEDFINVNQPVAGIDALMMTGIQRLAAAAEMPATILMFLSPPAGSGGNGGESEFDLWLHQCDGWREQEWSPRHRRVAELVLKAKDSPVATKLPEHWSIKYRALRVPQPKEVAEIRLIEAQTDAVNIDKGIYPAEVAAFRYGPGGKTTTVVLDEKELQANLARRRALANQPPKDNAELGTVGARSAAAIEVISDVATGRIARDSGMTLLIEIFRFTPEVAAKMLGPVDFEPTAASVPGRFKPGPAPDAPKPGGAGAPPQLPGVNDGGDPRKVAVADFVTRLREAFGNRFDSGALLEQLRQMSADVDAGKLGRENAIAMIANALGCDEETAEKMLSGEESESEEANEGGP
jgi:phage-related protein (TIGR01555 family)